MQQPKFLAVAALGAALGTLSLTLAADARPGNPPPHRAAQHVAHAEDAERAKASVPLWMEMRNVRLHVDEHAALRVADLRGEAVATTPGAIVVLDDPRSFVIDVSAGTVALDGD